MSNLSNVHWRGFLILHDVNQGSFSTQQVSLQHAFKKFPYAKDPAKLAKALWLIKPQNKEPSVFDWNYYATLGETK
jgi:hypothetical protein